MMRMTPALARLLVQERPKAEPRRPRHRAERAARANAATPATAPVEVAVKVPQQRRPSDPVARPVPRTGVRVPTR